MKSGAVAHPGERFNGIEEVASSSLASSTNHKTFSVDVVKCEGFIYPAAGALRDVTPLM